MYNTLLVEHRGAVGIIHLNRPNDGNAITLDLTRELLDAIIRCEEEKSIRAVILTGTGKMFCAGGDLKVFTAQAQTSEYIKEAAETFHKVISHLNRMDAPVICAANGMAAGGGFSLAMAADLVIAAESAQFIMAYTKIGLAPDGGASYLLPRLIGLRRAKELALLNPVLSARQALEWGLITQVVASDQVLPEALAIANRLAEGPTQAFGATKRLLLSGMINTFEEQMDEEAKAVAAMAGTTDGREGLSAFTGKRKPIFSGQ